MAQGWCYKYPNGPGQKQRFPTPGLRKLTELCHVLGLAKQESTQESRACKKWHRTLREVSSGGRCLQILDLSCRTGGCMARPHRCMSVLQRLSSRAMKKSPGPPWTKAVSSPKRPRHGCSLNKVMNKTQEKECFSLKKWDSAWRIQATVQRGVVT